MSYKYYYRIDFYHEKEGNKNERGCVMAQYRNSRIDRELMRKIEWQADLEMYVTGSKEVTAYIYRLEGEFTDDKALLDCTGYLTCIYDETRFSFGTKRSWFDATSNSHRYYQVWSDELPEEVKNSGRH